MSEYDLIAMGRCGVDLYPLQTGVGLEDVRSFGKFLGGSPTNVAVAAARLGSRVSLLTGVGDDPFGRYIRAELRRNGVNDDHVVVRPDYPTPVTFCEIFPPDDFPLYFYRQPLAPDQLFTPEDLPCRHLAAAKVLWLTVSGLAAEPSRSAHLAAVSMRPTGSLTVLDLDYRDRFWESEAAAREHIQQLLPHISAVVGNMAECQVAVGETEPERAAAALLERGVELAVVKLGTGGALARTAADQVWVPARQVRTVNGLGAGDAFGGALAYGLLTGWDLRRILQAASAAGAIVASRLECSNAMPTADELHAVLDGADIATLSERKGYLDGFGDQ